MKSSTTRRAARAVLALPNALLVDRTKARSSAGMDEFYDPPTPLPPGVPGDVIRAERAIVYHDPFRRVPLKAHTWRVMYRSTSATGEPMAVTGTLLVPRSPYKAGPRPLISHACGGHASMSPRSAPSIQMRRGAPSELHLVATYLARGWAVIVTDYQRFGGAGVHTFAISDAAGHAVIDAARAAQRVPGTDLDPGTPVAFTGYSEGGHGAAAAAERHPGYAPELNLVGVTCGGLPADLMVSARTVEGGLLFVCVPFAVAALKAAYPELPLDRLNDRGRAAVAEASQLSIEAGLLRYAFLTTPDLSHGTMNDFFLGQEQWRVRVEQQRLGRLTPTAPVFLYHGRFDPWNPLSTAMTLRDDWRAGGADIRFKTYRFAEHIAPVVEALPAVHRFLGAQFANAKTVDVAHARRADAIPSLT